MRITRFWRDAVRGGRGFLERRTGGEFWRLLGAAPARRPFTAGESARRLRLHRTPAGRPSASQVRRSDSVCRERALPACRAERSRVRLPLLLAAFTSEGGRSDLLKPQDGSPRSRFRRPLRRPKRSADTGSWKNSVPPFPRAGPLRLLECAPLPKGRQGPSFCK